MKRRFASLLILGFLGTTCAGEKVYHGDPSGLPLPDFTKKFETREFSGAQREVSTRTLDLREAPLPSYSGRLQTLPFSSWVNVRPDVYGKTMELGRFEGKMAPQGDKPALSEKDAGLAKPSENNGKIAPYDAEAVENGRTTDLPRSIPPDELKDVLNHGGSPALVHVGSTRKIQSSTAKSEKPLPPKWEPAK